MRDIIAPPNTQRRKEGMTSKEEILRLLTKYSRTVDSGGP